MYKYTFIIHHLSCLLQKVGGRHFSGPLVKGSELYMTTMDDDGHEKYVHTGTIVSIEKGPPQSLPFIIVYGNQAAFIPVDAIPINTKKEVLTTKTKEETVKVTIELVNPSVLCVCAFGHNLNLSAC